MNPIFRCYEARLHTLPGAPTLRTANHEQLVEHHHRMQALNADKIVPRFGGDFDPEPEGFWESACYGMLEHEDTWQQSKLVWSWIDEEPVWLSPADWDVEVLPEPKREMQRRFRFTLLGGGQITVMEDFKLQHYQDLKFMGCDTEMRVTADAGDGLKRYTGTIDKIGCEMNPAAVLFLPGTPQAIADRVAATFRLLTFREGIGSSCRGPDRENFAALLDRSTQCSVCGRALRDHVSTLLGIGPSCARDMGLPHGLTIANIILQRRHELLGDAAE